MAWYVLSLVIGAQTPTTSPPVWRLVDRPDLHVGVRPAVDVGFSWWAAGVTVQVSE